MGSVQQETCLTIRDVLEAAASLPLDTPIGILFAGESEEEPPLIWEADEIVSVTPQGLVLGVTGYTADITLEEVQPT